MDYEELFAQFILAVLAILFTFVINSSQREVAVNYNKNEEKSKGLGDGCSQVKDQEMEICKKVLRERLVHRNRSIIAASVKQTIEEEIGKLQHISNSIRGVKHLPRNPSESPALYSSCFTNTARKGNAINTDIMGLERNYLQRKTKTTERCFQPMQSKPSMLTTKKQPRFKQYSIYHFRVYLNNGITPLNLH